MYRIGELAKLAEVTPDTIRYYEKQQMMEHEVRTEGGFRLYTENDLQRLKFIRYARQLGFTLESIRELLSIRVDPEHHTCRVERNRAGKAERGRITNCGITEYAAFIAEAERCLLWNGTQQRLLFNSGSTGTRRQRSKAGVLIY